MVENEATDIEVQDYVEKLVNVVAKTMVKAFENLTIEDVNMFKLGYNKAIDDFSEKLSNKIKCEIDDCAEELQWINEIVERSKGVKQDAQS